ncbi:MAG: hypothetical protein OEZ22_02060 [Spirochaetia bacterium]|nr:hypothetical protein [Spirochaetia bacterium]
MLFIEFMRFQFSSWQKIFLKITAPLLKKDETDKVHGSLPFIASSALIVGFLPKEIAVLSFLFLLAGDPAAAYAGSRFGTIRFKNGKSIQGTAAAAIVCFVSGLIFLLFLSMNNNLNKEAYNLYLIKQGIINYKAFIVILTGAISAALLELISRRGFLDDNLIVPIGSGLFMTLLTAFLYNKSFSQIFYSIFDLLIPF